MRYRSVLLAAIVLAIVTQSGCGVSNPVDEVTVADSGITINESAAEAIAQTDWPQWRGHRNDGIVADQGLVTQWDEQSNVRWRTELPGRGHSSPIVVGNDIYLATADDKKQQQSVMSFDRQTGSPNWTTTIHEGGFPPAKQVHQKATNANGTIACDGNQLYISFLNGGAITATALDLDGNVVWQQELGKFVSKFGYAPSPILYKSLVIFAADNRGGGYLAALDGESGQVAWRIKRGAVDTYSSPVVATVGGQDQLLISGGGAVTSYDPTTGNQNWRTPCISSATCGTIVTTDHRIFASGGHPERETVCLSSDGERIWSNEVKLYEPSMLVVGDRLVAVTDDGIAHCWSIEDGQQQWRKRLGGNVSASPILVGQNIYVSNLKGETFVFRAGDRYEQIAKNRLGNDCYASPAVSNGEIFLRVGYGSGADRREQLVCIAGAE
jgi:outer membrane protein assembly factor BamB